MERQAAFADATLRLVARGGLEAVSIRTVAAEAGWSAGALQKTFSSKEELLTAAVHRVSEQVQARMAALPVSGDLAADVTAVVQETLPLDTQRREEALVWTAVAGRAATVSWMADILIEQDVMVLGHLATVIAAARPQEPDPGAVADAVVALADGWAIRLLYAPHSEEVVRRGLTRALDLLLQLD
jgi:AcrR family transcriptional regulator